MCVKIGSEGLVCRQTVNKQCGVIFDPHVYLSLTFPFIVHSNFYPQFVLMGLVRQSRFSLALLDL